MAKLLKEEGFSLQGNAKTAEGARHPDRDAQFRYISARAREHLAAAQPVISVDAKKKQNVGNFRNGGREWRPGGSPEPVNVYDFIDKDKGKVTPYGVYDVGANSGWVSAGTDHDTAAFAVQTIRTWWQKAGQPAYPQCLLAITPLGTRCSSLNDRSQCPTAVLALMSARASSHRGRSSRPAPR